MSDAANHPATGLPDNPYRGLVTMRMIRMFMTLRRAGILAQRRRFGLSEIEWRVMVELGDRNARSLNGLAEALVQDRGQLSRAVKGMVGRGLLTRERKPGGPEIEIALSEDGRKVHREMIGFVIERDRRLTADIPPDDLAALWRTVDTMSGRAQDMMDEELQAAG